MALVKTSLFCSYNLCFLCKITKNHFFWPNFCTKHPYEKFRFLDKIHGLTPLETVHFLALVNTSIFWSKNDCFLFKIFRGDFLWHNFREKQEKEKVRFLDKIHGLTPLETVHFKALVKTSIFWSKNHYFVHKYRKTIFSDIISVKNSDNRIIDFWTKSLDQPL